MRSEAPTRDLLPMETAFNSGSPRGLATILALVLLAGCTSSALVTVPTEFPVPLVPKLPLTIGVHLDDDLRSFSHYEEIDEQGNWRIEIGAAQRPMFEQLLTGMFEQVRLVDDPAAPQGVAGVLRPTIEEFQFSTPKQTRTDYFEVWIRYKFHLYDAEGNELGEWKMVAYGKANEGNYGLQSKEPALQAAAVAACRDAMAFFTLEFQKVPAVRTWLQGELLKEGQT